MNKREFLIYGVFPFFMLNYSIFFNHLIQTKEKNEKQADEDFEQKVDSKFSKVYHSINKVKKRISIIEKTLKIEK